MKKRRVLFVSLGCPKNQVDGELMLAKLQNAGFENADNFERLDAVIVNTCAFIDSAKQEAIDTILEMVGLKKDGLVRAVIVTGCLAERYRDEILQEIPEVDAVVGIGANGDIDKIVDEVLDGKQTNVFPDKKELPMCGERVLTTPDSLGVSQDSRGLLELLHLLRHPVHTRTLPQPRRGEHSRRGEDPCEWGCQRARAYRAGCLVLRH